MGLNIKHGLIDEQDIKNIAGLVACRYISGPVSYFDFVCDRICFFVYTVVEYKFICPNVSSSNV